jgi:hypothetical protein
VALKGRPSIVINFLDIRVRYINEWNVFPQEGLPKKAIDGRDMVQERGAMAGNAHRLKRRLAHMPGGEIEKREGAYNPGRK